VDLGNLSRAPALRGKEQRLDARDALTGLLLPDKGSHEWDDSADIKRESR
jgi:hypothetical protein